eukprot:Gregarina_sp_Poly_1__4407@NODE_237_length_10947_cov_116_066912_g209_i0_p1_GENE_NODE_237_length_10947_cov_116_066912_g209_i0NODE_237_length_10947_cov_116_066912_g209_i0_p1_ORF_typecomplete_len747_score83_36_NODE_237_length_10947_cov_116_066912_g209_i038376077
MRHILGTSLFLLPFLVDSQGVPVPFASPDAAIDADQGIIATPGMMGGIGVNTHLAQSSDGADHNELTGVQIVPRFGDYQEIQMNQPRISLNPVLSLNNATKDINRTTVPSMTLPNQNQIATSQLQAYPNTNQEASEQYRFPPQENPEQMPPALEMSTQLGEIPTTNLPSAQSSVQQSTISNQDQMETMQMIAQTLEYQVFPNQNAQSYFPDASDNLEVASDTLESHAPHSETSAGAQSRPEIYTMSSEVGPQLVPQVQLPSPAPTQLAPGTPIEHVPRTYNDGEIIAQDQNSEQYTFPSFQMEPQPPFLNQSIESQFPGLSVNFQVENPEQRSGGGESSIVVDSNHLSNGVTAPQVASHLSHPVDVFADIADESVVTTTKKPKKKKKRRIPEDPPVDYFIVEPPPPVIIHEVAPQWNDNLSTLELLHDIEERLERIEQSGAPQSLGLLPIQYFDEKLPEMQNIVQSNTPVYTPIQVTDEELLAKQAAVLSPYRQMPKEVTIYCYPFTPQEIVQKCLGAMETLGATGVYLPMMTEAGTEKPRDYYASVQTLQRMRRKDGKKYKIYGVAYDNPQWSLITQIVLNHKLWDGIMLEWVGGNACIWNINRPTRGQVDTILAHAGPLYYFFRQQMCDQTLILNSPYGAAFVNPNEEVDVSDINIVQGEFPKFLIPVFPCFQGEEGPCYNAFRYYTEDACSDKQVSRIRRTLQDTRNLQKFAFSPYEGLGGLMMHLANETCRGMPEHDLYSVV